MTIVLLLVGGLLALVIGAEWLVRGAVRISDQLRFPPVIVGLTVVAFGTSAPELAVSAISASHHDSELALGNVVGSNIFNVLFILGLSALILPLTVHIKLIRFDVPVMILVTVAACALTFDGTVGRLDGMLLLTGLLIYTVWCVLEGVREAKQSPANLPGMQLPAGPSSDQLPAVTACNLSATESKDGSKATTGVRRKTGFSLLLVLTGLGLLVLGAEWLVDGASSLARRFGISELTIGLTVVAAGTSLPELATSIVAALRGQRDL
ncbi:MAG: calcium/sodium antiporter, partial [Planctomycetaceae bacterium]|nr:calcium/sodium antiporter [Planctomycetaceae bacterium]